MHKLCVMITLTIIMSLVVVLLLPIHVGIDLYIDMDNKCLVVLISMYGIIFFDSMIDTDGTNINYKGSINGSIAIVDIDFVDIDDILLSMQYRSVGCDIGTNMNNCKHIGWLSGVLALSSMLTPILNDLTDTTMSTRCNMCESNYINLAVHLSTTPLAFARALNNSH